MVRKIYIVGNMSVGFTRKSKAIAVAKKVPYKVKIHVKKIR